MLNRTPSNSSNVINNYRKRRLQKGGPFLLYGAVALVIIGAIMLVVWLMGPDKPLGQMFATDTPTPTLTFTPTNTPSPTITSTITVTPTVTITPTPSGPQQYTIQEGDSLEAIAKKFNLGNEGSLLIYYANQKEMEANSGTIYVGQTITIPPAGSVLPSMTPIPASLSRGTKVQYTVLPGDTLAGIAVRFNSNADEIVKANDLTDANALQVGQVLQIPVNLVTATATLSPSSTPVTPTVPAGQATSAPASTSAAANCSYQESGAFVTDLQTLINNTRTSNNASALSTNAQLVAVAKNHAVDMLCNNYFSDIGLDKSTPQERVARAGFTASSVAELIYASPTGDAKAALDWWMANQQNKANILQPDFTAVGIAYVKSSTSLFGGYFVVIEAKP